VLRQVWKVILVLYMAVGFETAVDLASHGDRRIPGPFGSDNLVRAGMYGLFGCFFVLGVLWAEGERKFFGMDRMLWTCGVVISYLAGVGVGLFLALT